MKEAIKLSDHFTYSRLIRFTLPSVLMMVIGSVYSIVDGLFISNYAGSDAFAAVNLIMPVLMIAACPAFMAGAGGSAYVSKLLGEGREDDARSAFSLIVYLLLAVSAVIVVFILLAAPWIARRLGAEGRIYTDCVTYGRVLGASLPAFMLQIFFQSFMVVAEKPKMGLVIAVSSGVTNMVLDALLVGYLKLGVAGAAAATLIGQCIGGMYPMLYFAFRKNHLLWFTRPLWRMGTVTKTASNGFSSFLTNLSTSLVSMAFNIQLMSMTGSDGVVAFGVVMYVSYIVVGMFNGYSTGIAPVFSYDLGSRNSQELKSLFKKSVVVIAALSVVMTTLFIVFARSLAAIFVSYDENLMALTEEAVRLYGISFYLAGFNIFVAAYFAAMNNGTVSGLLSILRILVFQIGAVFLLPLALGEIGIWLSVTLAEALSLAVTLYFLHRLPPGKFQ